MSSVWRVYVDESSGKPYYANTVSGAVTWDKPAELDTPAPAPPPETPVPQWACHLDKTTNKYYYYNPSTRETRWELPPDTPFVPPAQSIATTPTAVAVVAAVATTPTAATPVVANPNHEWTHHFDYNTNQYYYVNNVTKATQWEKPPGYILPRLAQQRASASESSLPQQAQMNTQTISHSQSHSRQLSASVLNALTGLPAKPILSPRAVPPPSENKQVPVLPALLRSEIANFQSAEFAERHFRTVKQRQGWNKRELPVEQVMKWQPDEISQSLLHTSKKYDSSAVNTFKYILSFMGDKPSTKSPDQLANLVISSAIQQPILRDEIFCQLCKQTASNPNRQGLLNGWRLFALCVASFAPSRAFENFVKAYIAKNFNEPNEVHIISPYCFWRLERTIKIGVEQTPPTLADVDDILMKGIPVCKVMFGASLDYILMLQQTQNIMDPIPLILKKLTDAVISLGGTQVQGVFRVASEKSDVLRLRKQFEKGDFEVKANTAYVVADLLKIWLRELSEPLIPTSFYKESLKYHNDGPQAISYLQSHLPSSHWNSLDYLMKWLQQFAQHHQVTSMTAENLAIVFCQNLLRSSDDIDPQQQLQNSEKEKNLVRNLISSWQS